MSQSYKFVNLNPFPIFLPDERGGQVMFRHGEGTDKHWFSRFVGERQLARVPVKAKHRKGGSATSVEDSVISVAIPNLSAKKPSFPDKETAEYSLSSGIYRCKLCGQFLTASFESLKMHLNTFHMKPAQEVKLGDGEGDGEKVVIPSMQEAAPKADDSEEVDTRSTLPRTDEPIPQVSESPEPKEEEFVCPVQGCGKSFTSKRGLSMHTMRMHHD